MKLKIEHDRIQQESELIEALKSIITKECLIHNFTVRIIKFEKDLGIT